MNDTKILTTTKDVKDIYFKYREIRSQLPADEYLKFQNNFIEIDDFFEELCEETS